MGTERSSYPRKTLVLCRECHHRLHAGTLPDKEYLRKHGKGEPCASKGASTVSEGGCRMTYKKGSRSLPYFPF